MNRFNLLFFEGLLLIAVGARFLLDPVAGMMMALGGTVTLFQSPFLERELSRGWKKLQTFVGIGAIAVAFAMISIWLLSRLPIPSGETLMSVK